MLLGCVLVGGVLVPAAGIAPSWAEEQQGTEVQSAVSATEGGADDATSSTSGGTSSDGSGSVDSSAAGTEFTGDDPAPDTIGDAESDPSELTAVETESERQEDPETNATETAPESDDYEVVPFALGTVTAPPVGSHFTRTIPGAYETVVPHTIAGYAGEVCAVTITALAGAGGNANDTASSAAGHYRNGAGAAATATYQVRPGMQISGHVGEGGKYQGIAYADPAFTPDIAGYTTMVFGSSSPNSNSRARASGGSPDGGFGGDMPGSWWGNIRHVGAGGGGSSLVTIAGQELVMVGGGGGNSGGHATNVGEGGDGGQPLAAGVTPGEDGTVGADNQWYQAHSDGSNTGSFNENLANSNQGTRTISWTNRMLNADSAFLPGGGKGGGLSAPGAGGLHTINGNPDTVIPVTGFTPASNSSYLRNQRNSLLHGFDAQGRVGGNGGHDQVYFRGIDPVGARRAAGNPDTGGGGGGGYFGGGGGASTIGYGLDVHRNTGIAGGGGGGGASFVSPGGIQTSAGNIGVVRGIDSGLGPKALSNRNGANGFVALTYSTDCGSASKSVDLEPMSSTIVNETGQHAQPGQLVKYTLNFKAPSTGDYVVQHTDHLGDVLDDATWVGDIQYGNSATIPAGQTSPYSPGIVGVYDAANEQIAVMGTVPAGQTRTVSFLVRVLSNTENTTERNNGDVADSPKGFLLRNFLTENGEVPPAECEPGDPRCTENPLLGGVIWQKVDADGNALAGSEWLLTGPGGASPASVAVTDCIESSAANCLGADKDSRAGHFEISGLDWGSYLLEETKAPPGYVIDVPIQREFVIGIIAGSDGNVVIDLGEIVNTRATGSVSWQKIDPEGVTLAGSEWRIIGPTGTHSQVYDIVDCAVAPATQCDDNPLSYVADWNPDAGEFWVGPLPWGEYTLVETSAPDGYVLDETVHHFTIDANETAVLLDPIENTPRIPLTIPLTGGLGADAFLIGGGGLIALLTLLALLRLRRAGVLVSAIPKP